MFICIFYKKEAQLPRILRSKLGVATIVPTATREWIVATLEFAGHLFVGGATAGHQHHMETGQTKNWYRQYCDQCHQNDSVSSMVLQTFFFFFFIKMSKKNTLRKTYATIGST